jgi:hypothetical protein
MKQQPPITANAEPALGLRDPLLRSLVSLALVLHLLCVGFVYSANDGRNASRLQQRLAGIFAPYTQLLHLDPGGARLQFTNGSPENDDYLLLVAPKLGDGSIGEADAIHIPADESRLGLQRRRLLALTADLAAFGDQREDLAAQLAQSIGESVMRERQLDHVVIQLIHQGAEPLYDDTPEDERSSDYTMYDAEVWRDEDGMIHTQKRTTGLGAAPTSQGAGS